MMNPNGRSSLGTNAAPLKIAVVGHTNTGKTSLMRTLSRDETFGEVSDRPAVTRDVEGIVLLVNGRPTLELYDTPGLEDSIGLFDHLNSLRESHRAEEVVIVERFLDSETARKSYSQEAKAIRQVMASDIALYVIDARDRVLGKHRDELEILSMCARPIVPVLNFIARPEARTNEWREHLARINLHAVAEFDTVVFDERGELRLFEKVKTLLPPSSTPAIDALIEDRKRLRERLIANSASIIAEMLLDAASFRIIVERVEKQAIERAVEELRNTMRRREQRCVDDLLELHRFRKEDCQPGDLPITEERWGIDLFNPEAMKQFGVRFGSGAAAGATAGLLLDVLTGGLSLGAGTAAGAAIGGAIGGQKFGRRLIDKVRGRSEVRCDDATLMLLDARQIALVRALLHRGHAAVQPVHLEQAGPARKTIPEELRLARARPDWSSLASPGGTGRHARDPQREVSRRRLADAIVQSIVREEVHR